MSDAYCMKLSLIFAGLALISSAALGGCAAPADAGEPEIGTSEAALGEAGTITFRGDFAETVEGRLEKGKKVRVVYDPARLTACRGEQSGRPAWSITGYWRIGDGPVRSFEAGGHSPSGGTSEPVLALDASGQLQVWFQNTSVWGCSAYDSDFGNNYRFAVGASSNEPGWVGNPRVVIARATCGGICDADLRPVSSPIVFDTWARQRASITALTFEVWKDGVTNWDNPDQWKQLDVQVHSRVGSTGAFTSRYVRFDRRLGHNARYAVDLRALDPLEVIGAITSPAQCPPLERPAGSGYVASTVELYVTVNGVELRPEGGGTFRVRYENYASSFASCP